MQSETRHNRPVHTARANGIDAAAGSEGRARDFLAEHPGFIMDSLVGCFSASSKRVLVLLLPLTMR